MDLLFKCSSVLVFVSSILASFLLSFCLGQKLTASFIFGDSLVDAGNNNYLPTVSKANIPPFGIDLLPYHQPTGRFTNGRTIPDIIGQELGLENSAPPFLAPGTFGAAVFHGVNYASGGGGISLKTGKVFGVVLDLDMQIDDYGKTRKNLISTLGGPGALRLLREEALFSVTIGSNDFINNYLAPILSVPKRTIISPETFAEAMLSKLRGQLMKLYDLDARKFLVTNVGPIGCIPYLREQSVASVNNCLDFANQIVQYFNSRLKDLVMELSSNLDAATFLYADVYGIVSEIIQNYGSYGFEVADSACCSLAGRYGGLLPCSLKSKLCPDRTKYIFWDPYHPTEATNVIIAKRLLDGDSNDIFPMNLRQLSQA